MKIFEPKGTVRIAHIVEPINAPSIGKIWFVQNMEGQRFLHVGYQKDETLYVWKSRLLKRYRNHLVSMGWRRHERNPILDQEIFENVVSVPFLQK